MGAFGFCMFPSSIYSTVSGNLKHYSDVDWSRMCRTCRYIAFDATTVSTATLEQKKADRKYLTELVSIKLKAIKEIKENPELLKHLKISTVTYVPTGAHVVVEWKEGFVYSNF